jgi:phosphate transport system substrate-binding protein
MVMGSVVVTFNISGVDNLKFDGPTLAKIFLGEIKKWDDAAITALNPDAKLPSADIQVAHRSDGSGTSFTFTDYLSKVSADWKTKVGTNSNPNWPAGLGGKGNEGVTTLVKQTPNSIGYVELAYAIENKLTFADLKNKAGKFVTPSLEATSAAAAGVTFPEDYRISLTDASGDATYPIVTATYLLVYKDMASCSKAIPLVHFMWWAFHAPEAASMAKELRYAPIPSGALPAIEKTLKSLKCEGKSILPE